VVKDLEESIFNYFFKQITIYNAFQIYDIGSREGNSGLMKNCKNFMINRFEEMTHTEDGFNFCEKKLLLSLLKSGEIECDDEIIISACEGWVRNSVDIDLDNDRLRLMMEEFLPPKVFFSRNYKDFVLGKTRNKWF